MHNRNALRFHRGYSPPPDFDAILREMPTHGPVTVQVTKAAAARAAAIAKAKGFKTCRICIGPGFCERDGVCLGERLDKAKRPPPRPRVTEAALIEKAAGLAHRVESIAARLRPPPAPPPASPEDSPIVKAAKAIAAEHVAKARDSADDKLKLCAKCPDVDACRKVNVCKIETGGPPLVRAAMRSRREHETRGGSR